MKTSTMLLIGGAAVAGYVLAKRKLAATAATAAQATQAVQTAAAATQAAPVPAAMLVEPDDAYYIDPSWGWGPSVFVGGLGRGGGGHHHGGGGGGHHGGHH